MGAELLGLSAKASVYNRVKIVKARVYNRVKAAMGAEVIFHLESLMIYRFDNLISAAKIMRIYIEVISKL